MKSYCHGCLDSGHPSKFCDGVRSLSGAVNKYSKLVFSTAGAEPQASMRSTALPFEGSGAPNVGFTAEYGNLLHAEDGILEVLGNS